MVSDTLRPIFPAVLTQIGTKVMRIAAAFAGLLLVVSGVQLDVFHHF